MTNHSRSTPAIFKSEQAWVERVAQRLIGRKITSVLYLPAGQAEEMDWCRRPIVLELDDGSFIYPLKDEEGNDGGVLATSYEELPVVPCI